MLLLVEKKKSFILEKYRDPYFLIGNPLYGEGENSL